MVRDEFVGQLDVALRGASIALFLVIAFAVLRKGHGRPAAWLGTMLSIGAAAYAICSTPDHFGLGSPWFVPVLALCAGNVVVFWLFTRAVFDDSFRPGPWHVLLWLALTICPVAALLGADFATSRPVKIALRIVPVALVLLASLRSAAIFSLLGACVAVAVRQDWITIYRNFDEAGPLYLVLSLAFMLVAHDASFYWTHRAMHHPRLFRLFHRLHHLSRTPTPWAAYSFSVPEAIVQGAFVPLFLALVPMHGVAVFAFGAVQIVRNVMGHAGIELHSAAFGPGRWLSWNNTTTYHDLHHETGRYNYGLYFRWWDKLIGTEHPGYRRKSEAVIAGAGS